MRILLVPASYSPVLGGLQTVVQSLVRHFALQHEVRVITNRYPLSLPATENLDGVRIDRLLLLRPEVDQLRRKRLDLFLASLYFYPTSYEKLRSLLQRFRPEVVNVHYPDHQIPFVLKLRKEFDFRLVVSLHGHDVEQFLNGNGVRHEAQTQAARFRAILQAADAVTAVSQNLLHKAIEVEPTISGKSRVIHNGVDSARFESKRWYEHPRPYIFAFGRLTKKKGFDLLIDAFAQHRAQCKADLILAGKGEEEDALRAQVARLGLASHVKFFGQASPREVIELLNGCLGVVVPSRVEPFGIVALEALAAGKPVLATKIGGLQEFLREFSEFKTENGESKDRPSIFLVEPSVDGIAGGLSELFAQGFQIGRAKHYLPERFTWPYLANNYEHVLLGSEPQTKRPVAPLCLAEPGG